MAVRNGVIARASRFQVTCAFKAPVSMLPSVSKLPALPLTVAR